jgi:hypothetical protein
MITDWIVRALEPALERMARKRSGVNELATVSRDRDNPFYDCDTVRLSVIHVSNGTLLRMDSRSRDEDYIVKNTRPPAPNIVIVKDDENLSDAVVRMLAIAQLERL